MFRRKAKPPWAGPGFGRLRWERAWGDALAAARGHGLWAALAIPLLGFAFFVFWKGWDDAKKQVGGLIVSVVGPVILFGVVLLAWHWLRAPGRLYGDLGGELAQAQDELAELRGRTFPRGRIEVRAFGWVEPEEGERYVLFGFKATNREMTRKMNLEVEFMVKMFMATVRRNPGLRPVEETLYAISTGKNPPPDPLIIDAQESTQELVYSTRPISGDGGLVFDRETFGIRTERDDDELVVRVRDLQSGGEIEVQIPGVWES
jgi:hypothetical protein